MKALQAHLSPPERPRQDVGFNTAERVAPSCLQVLEDDLGRAEQEGIDGVIVVVVSGEDRREWFAMVTRRGRRDLRSDLFDTFIIAGEVQDHASTVKDRVVGSTDGRQVIASDGGSGAEPWADWIRPRSNLSSASLCIAVSTERATTCTPPARLAVGAARRNPVSVHLFGQE